MELPLTQMAPSPSQPQRRRSNSHALSVSRGTGEALSGPFFYMNMTLRLSKYFTLILHISLGLLLASCGNGMKPTQEGSKPFEESWESLANVNEEPDWFKDAKFGIYFHWGVYSVPAYGSEWYPRMMHVEGLGTYEHHLEKFRKNHLAEKAWMTDGSIPEDQRQVLLEMGEWLNRYGEAIYDTRPWYTFGEGHTQEPENQSPRGFNGISYTAKDVRYTTSGESIYAILLGKPEPGEQLLLEAFSAEKLENRPDIRTISVPGSTDELDWKLTDAGLSIQIPEGDLDKRATVFKIQSAP